MGSWYWQGKVQLTLKKNGKKLMDTISNEGIIFLINKYKFKKKRYLTVYAYNMHHKMQCIPKKFHCVPHFSQFNCWIKLFPRAWEHAQAPAL